ncbi:LysR family transcriptional regulator [Burkholderia sp. AU33423]|uniref:LysR substrate-binding domain-containing protein n=1 Tax=Burkholderia sp. AU33423 TaxID=2015355 RepID=UPI000B7A68BB|nr:LysR substrate-binding domain-containing protein [Burkholderia sp. AU33423]OXI88643.1 LysR family transcriptional regulator [Burkholderia sp. AU33423]
MLDLRRLRYFVVVADELHFGRAALRLRVAQPPLTRHIAALESELGVRLFERSTRAVRLTPEGAAFLDHARHVVSAAAEAEASARKIAQGIAGRIVIGYASSIPMSDTFPDVIRVASRTMPDVQLTFREAATASQRQQIADGTMDIGFGWAWRGAPGVPVASLVASREPLVAAVPAGDPLAGHANVDVAALANATFVTFPPGYGSALTAALHDLCAQAGFTPRIGATAAQITTLVSLVAAERGIAIVPGFTATLQRPGVVYVPLAGTRAVEQIVSWNEPFTSVCVERFVALARSLVQSPSA